MLFESLPSGSRKLSRLASPRPQPWRVPGNRVPWPARAAFPGSGRDRWKAVAGRCESPPGRQATRKEGASGPTPGEPPPPKDRASRLRGRADLPAPRRRARCQRPPPARTETPDARARSRFTLLVEQLLGLHGEAPVREASEVLAQIRAHGIVFAQVAVRRGPAPQGALEAVASRRRPKSMPRMKARRRLRRTTWWVMRNNQVVMLPSPSGLKRRRSATTNTSWTKSSRSAEGLPAVVPNA